MVLQWVHNLLKSISCVFLWCKALVIQVNGIYTPQFPSVIGWLALSLWQSMALSYEGVTSHLLWMQLSPGQVFIYVWGFLT